MTDKIIKLDNGLECYIMYEIDHDRKKYCMAQIVNTSIDEVSNQFIVCEELIKNGKLYLNDIHDVNEKNNISNLILEKIKLNIKDSNK